MYLVSLKNLFSIAKLQFKLILAVNFLLAVILSFLAPIMFATKYLDSYGSSFVLERFISLTGIILITPLFMPEQDKSIDELVRSKKTEHSITLILRLAMSLLFMALCITAIIAVMRYWHCDFETGKFITGTFITAFFLGTLGFTFHAVTNNVVVGFLAAFAYYLLNFTSGRKLGRFYLFSLTENSMEEKYWILALGIILLFISLLWKNTFAKMR